MDALRDFAGEFIVGLTMLAAWWQIGRARQREQLEGAKRQGELDQWRRGVDNRLDSRSAEHEAMLARVEGIRASSSKEHAALRTEVSEQFRATDQLINGVMGEVRELRGELHGSGALHRQGGTE